MTWEVGLQIAFIGSAIAFIMISDKITLNEERFPNMAGVLKLMLIFMSFFLIATSIITNIPIIDTALLQNQTNITFASDLKSSNNSALIVVLITSVVLFMIMLTLFLVHLFYNLGEVSRKKGGYEHPEQE